MPEAREKRSYGETRPGEAGIALIVTILLLLMISSIGLAALQHAGDETVVATSSRRKLATVYVADSGLRLIGDQLLNGGGRYPDMTPLDQPSLFTDEAGFPIAARTGSTDTAAALPPLRVGRTVGSGSQLNVNAANTTSYGVYRVGVVATDSSGGQTQLQAQFTVPEGSASYR